MSITTLTPQVETTFCTAFGIADVIVHVFCKVWSVSLTNSHTHTHPIPECPILQHRMGTDVITSEPPPATLVSH